MEIKRTNFITKFSKPLFIIFIQLFFIGNGFAQWRTSEANNISSDIIISYEVLYEKELTLEEKNSPEYIKEINIALNKDILIERKIGNKIATTNNYTLYNYKTLKAYNCYNSVSSKIAIENNFTEPSVPVELIPNATPKSIFGYPCERGLVSINNLPKEVIYTKKIGLRYCKGLNIDGFLLECPGFNKKLGYYTVKAKKITYNNNLQESFFSLAGFTVQKKEELSKISKEREEKLKTERSQIIGTKAPNIKETSMKNKLIDSKKLLETIIVYNFWFTTCVPCKAEIPKLNQLREKYKDKNIQFVAIGLDPAYKINEFTQKIPLNYDIIAEGRWIADKFDISSYPTNLIVDGKGIIQFYEVGYKSDILERMSYEIEKQLTQ